MSALAVQQQAVLAALFAERAADARQIVAAHPASMRAGDLDQWQRGLSAYRANGRALAARALAAVYPGVRRLIGDENFEPLARLLWTTHPPSRGDLAEWGEALAALIAALPDLATAEPHLADVARVEWALHRCASAPDMAADRSSFGLLAVCDPIGLRLLLAPGCAVIASPHPVVDWLSGDEIPLNRPAQTAVVWREGFQPRLRGAGR